jgi:ubiquinone/menaquinone biosynthesis C-methylase UbiE
MKNNLRKKEVIELYDDFAHVYDTRRYETKKQKITSTIVLEVASELVGNTKDKMVLDAGCGTGRFTDFFIEEGANVISADTSKNMLKFLMEKNLNAKAINADIFNLPFKNNSFDLIVCSQVLTHLREYKRPLAEFKRILNSDGIIIIDIRNVLYPIHFIRKYILPKTEIDRDSRYNPDITHIFKIMKICDEINLKIDDLRGVGLSFIRFISKESEKRIAIEKSRSNTILRYVAPTLIIKIKRKD